MPREQSPPVSEGGTSFKRLATLYNFALNQRQLRTAIARATAGFPESAVSITAVQDFTEFTGHSFQTVMDKITCEVGHDDVQRLDTLKVECSDGHRRVLLHFNEDRVEIEASSIDITWANGRRADLQEYLAQIGARKRRWRISPNVVTALAIAAAATFGFAGLGLTDKQLDGWMIGLAATSTVLAGITAHMFGRRRRNRAEVRLYLLEAAPKGGWSQLSTTDKLFTVSTIIAFVGLVLRLIGV